MTEHSIYFIPHIDPCFDILLSDLGFESITSDTLTKIKDKKLHKLFKNHIGERFFIENEEYNDYMYKRMLKLKNKIADKWILI